MGDVVDPGGAFEDCLGDFAGAMVIVPATGAHQVEGLVEADSAHPRECSLGLLDDDSAVEGALRLFDELVGATRGPLLQQTDRGDGGQCVDDPDVRGFKPARVGAEQAESTDDVVLVSQGDGVRCPETSPARHEARAEASGRRPRAGRG